MNKRNIEIKFIHSKDGIKNMISSLLDHELEDYTRWCYHNEEAPMNGEHLNKIANNIIKILVQLMPEVALDAQIRKDLEKCIEAETPRAYRTTEFYHALKGVEDIRHICQDNRIQEHLENLTRDRDRCKDEKAAEHMEMCMRFLHSLQEGYDHMACSFGQLMECINRENEKEQEEE